MKKTRIFKNVLKSNVTFWKFYNEEFSRNNGTLLYENFYNNENLIYGITKTALIISNILQLKPIALLSSCPRSKLNLFSKSMCFDSINIYFGVFFQFFISFFNCISFYCKTKCKSDLIDFEFKSYKIGKHIYDSILIKYKIPTINKFTFKIRFYVFFNFLVFLFFKRCIKRRNVKFVVLGDNVYRYGLLFEICRVNKIKCISPVSLNMYTFCKFFDDYDFMNSSYSVSDQFLNTLLSDLNFKRNALSYITEYYNRRFQGVIMQHDVLNAYKGKKTLTKSEFFSKYKLDSKRITIAIFPHIFSDAPHAYANCLYDDYYDWFSRTVELLKMNNAVNFIIKEHPSSHLYGEEGLVHKILQKYNLEDHLIDLNESTTSVINSCDIAITCGGTIGLEFTSMGKNVILASYPPYSKLGFTIDSADRFEYENILLSDFSVVKKLNELQVERSLICSYIIFCLYKNKNKNLEIGSEEIYLGKVYNEFALYEEIIEYNKIKLEKQVVYDLIRNFLSSDYKVLNQLLSN